MLERPGLHTFLLSSYSQQSPGCHPAGSQNGLPLPKHSHTTQQQHTASIYSPSQVSLNTAENHKRRGRRTERVLELSLSRSRSLASPCAHTHSSCKRHQSQPARPWQHIALHTIALTSETAGLMAEESERATKRGNSPCIPLFLQSLWIHNRSLVSSRAPVSRQPISLWNNFPELKLLVFIWPTLQNPKIFQ